MELEKRRSFRKPFSVQVTCRVDTQDRTEAFKIQSVNICREGLLLKTDLPLGIGTKIKLEFTLPTTGELVKGEGEVVWSSLVEYPGTAPFVGKGIKFRGCGSDCREFLKEFMGETSK